MSKSIKVAFLWTGLSGYMNACLKALASQEGVELLVCHSKPTTNAPFDESLFQWMRGAYSWSGKPDVKVVLARLDEFCPDILVVCGWHIGAYRHAARQLSKRSWRVMTMDNCWQGSAKQILGTMIGPLTLPLLADAVWVPGERQVSYAQMLGFKQHDIMRGLYSCDTDVLEDAYRQRIERGDAQKPAFAFIGRFVPEKGIMTLVLAYEEYREKVRDPWPMYCYGSGPLKTMLENREGIEVRGFIQPDKLTKVLSESTCLVLPSNFEPWGVVVHEAVTAGLLVIASDKVGASIHLVQPGYNGYIFDSGDVHGCTCEMVRVHDSYPARTNEMSEVSRTLSTLYSPRRWAQTLLESFAATRNTQSRQVL
jgi:glycosyltransferase involved in cell wall biosynthesis